MNETILLNGKHRYRIRHLSSIGSQHWWNSIRLHENSDISITLPSHKCKDTKQACMHKIMVFMMIFVTLLYNCAFSHQWLIFHSQYITNWPSLCTMPFLERREMRPSAHEIRKCAVNALRKHPKIQLQSHLPPPTVYRIYFAPPPNHPENPDFMAFVASSFALSSSAASSLSHFSPFSRISLSKFS